MNGDPFLGQTFGKYQVLEKIGEGGMGVVYKGRQLSLNRDVAIKVLPRRMAVDEDFVRRFHQEAEVIARLTHDNIVYVFDIDQFEGAYYIVMEYVDGHSLRQYRGRPLTADQVRAVGIPVARALGYAHQRGIVHRDVKSSNVMVTSEGKIKLMDFGIAKTAGGVKTVTGSVLGTPEYMAPEQVRGEGVTAQSDVYALGVLLYELAVGNLPFAAEDPFALAFKHITETPVPPSQRQASVPPWLDQVILCAMAKDLGKRYPSAAALEEDLRRAGGGRSTTPTFVKTIPMAETRAPPGLAARPPTPEPAPAAVPPIATPTPGTPAPPSTVRRGLPPGWLATGAAVLLVAIGLGVWLRSGPDAPPALSSRDHVAAAGPSPTLRSTPGEDPTAGTVELEGEGQGAQFSPPTPQGAQQTEVLDPAEPPPSVAPTPPPASLPPPRTRAQPTATPPATAPPDATPPAKPPPAAPPPVSVSRLWFEAEDLKDREHYHSLAAKIDQVLAADPSHEKADRWRQKVSDWMLEQEEELRDEVDSFLGEFVDAIDGKDLEDLDELWGERIDDDTTEYFRDLFGRYPVIRGEYSLGSVEVRDNSADFTARIEIRAKPRRGLRVDYEPVFETDWNGRLDRGEGKRFTRPFP